MGPGNHVLDGVQVRMGREILRGKGHPIVKYRDILWSSVQKWLNQSRCCLGCGLEWAQGIVLDEAQIPIGRGIFWRKVCPLYSVGTFCHSWVKTAEPIDLPFGLWTWVGQRKQNFNRICLVAPMCPHGRYIGATWRIRLNRPSAAAVRPYVRLL